MNILITGVAIYIGSQVVKSLRQKREYINLDIIIRSTYEWEKKKPY
jgi:nucleoside-diphosphate-sugar epimerase